MRKGMTLIELILSMITEEVVRLLNLLLFFSFLSITISSASDQCSSGFSQAFTATNTSYSTDQAVNNGHPTDSYYFSVNQPGRLIVTLSGSDVTAGNVKFTGSQNPSSCPGTAGNLTTNTYTFNSAGDLNIKAYINGSNSNQNYTLTATFIPLLLIADYHMDECLWNGTAGEVKDSSGNNLNGTAINGTTTITDGKIDNSAYLNPTTATIQYIEIPDNNLLDGTNKLTIMGWINPSTYTPINGNALGVLSKRVSSGSQYAYGIFMGFDYNSCTADKLLIDIDGGGNRFCTNGSIPLNQWTHFTVTYDGTLTSSQRVKVYLNGILDKTATESSASIPNSTAPLRIGSLYESTAEPKVFKGKIDEIKVYNQSLSASTVNTIYNNENIGKNHDGTLRTPSCCCIPTGGNLIANPSFETLCGTSIIETWNGVEGGTVNMRNNVCGWTMNGSGMETWENTTLKPASNGTVFVEIDGYITTVDRLSQNLNTLNGTHYVISFDYRARNGGSDRIIAKWNGTEVGIFNGITTGWKTAQIEVVGTGLDTLAFEEPSADNDSLGSWIDNIRAAKGTLATNCTSFKYEPYHSYNINLTPSYRLHTRISQQPFDLNVTVACTDSGTIPSRKIKNIYAIDALATSCNASTAKLSTLLSNGAYDINDTSRIINIPGLNVIKAYSNIKLMLETNASEFNCSSDSFTIRPPSYSISSPSSPIKAADFTLQISAASSGSGYNGTASVTTGLQTVNPNCPVSNGFLKSILTSTEPHAITFQNDINSSAMKAIDIGAVYLNTKDSAWTAIDQPNDCINDNNSTTANIQGLVGCNIESNISLVIIPNNFDVTGALSNFTGGSFTYLSDDLAMSSALDLNITAKNGDGNTTKNYTSGCYSKDTTLTLLHSAVPDPLTKILYTETLSAVDTNVLKADPWILTFPAGLFTSGSAIPNIDLNFDRLFAEPLNPFDFNITSASVTDTDAVSGNGIPLGNATFVYGRARAYDVTTNETSAPNPIEFEVYSTTSGGFVSGMPQNILKWYRNLNHDSAASGNIIQGGFTAGGNDIDTSTAPSDGIQIVTVTSAQDQTIHLDISPWLWYSPKYNYDYATDCTQHPCFLYDYTDTGVGVKGVNSGSFQGSDFQMVPAKNITNKGVKLFR